MPKKRKKTKNEMEKDKHIDNLREKNTERAEKKKEEKRILTEQRKECY